MNSYAPQIDWLLKEQPSMLALLQDWADINSGSDNIPGLANMMSALKPHFSRLGGEMRELKLPPRTIIDSTGKFVEIPHGKALSILKRSQAPVKVFLGGHMDTVYPLDHPFQKSYIKNPARLQGPGVADMKGGLIVMLKALEALEQHPAHDNIGWEILINPDEEVGSIGSGALLTTSSKRNSLGLIFEPAFPDGAIVSARKGSANFTVIAKGQAAHSGRDFHKGRNAIAALAKFIVEAHQLSNAEKEITVNIGQIHGGGPVNVVPDLAICRLNVRTVNIQDIDGIQASLEQVVRSTQSDGISLSLHLENSRPPKLFDEKNQNLFEQIRYCAEQRGLQLSQRSSGGASDGNLMSAEGLPVIDSLGVIGGNIHTTDEYMLIDSLSERASLVALFLMKLASGEIPFKERYNV